MIGLDAGGRDGGGRRKDIPLTYSPSFHFFLFLSFSLFLSFLFSSFFFFCDFFILKDISNFHKDVEEFLFLKKVCKNVV